MFGMRRRESVDGIELTMALNHFAYHQLTVGVLARIAPDGRIVNVASTAYSFAKGRFPFDSWQASARRDYRPTRQYGRSKLANILFTRALADRVRGGADGARETDSAVRVVAWAPKGLTATRFAYGANPLAPLAMKLTHPFAAKTDDAVQSLLELCDREIPPGEHGAFFDDDTIDPCRSRRPRMPSASGR